MKKITFIVVLLVFLVCLTACSGKPAQVKDVFEEDGQKVYVVSDAEAEEDVEKRSLSLLDINKIAEAEYGFYLYSGDILIGRSVGDGGVEFTLYNNNTGKKEFFAEFKNGNYFKISPDGKKLLYAGEKNINTVFIKKSLQEKGAKVYDRNIVPDLERSEIEWMDRKNDYLHISLTWLDSNKFAYCDRDGNVYTESITGDYKKKYILDSNFKLNITEVKDRLYFIKNRGYKNLDLEINEPAYDRFLKKQKGNYLSYADQQANSGLVIDRKGNLHIKGFKISPDHKKIALYFEDEKNKGLLTITDFSGKLSYSNLKHVSNDLVEDFIWSHDSKYLLYSTSGSIPGLYTVNNDGSGKKQVVANKKIESLHCCSNSGYTLLAVEKQEERNNVYEIKLEE